MHEIAVIGAGIVGLSTAMQLQRDGWRVVVIDPNAPASGCSSGNAGYLSQANIFPPSSTESLFSLPRMLLKPDGPLSLQLRHLPRFLPWGIAAALATREARLARTVEALKPLIRPAIDAYAPLLEAAGARHMIVRNGALVVARTQAGLAARGARVPQLKAHGIDVDFISAGEVRELEPDLSGDILGAIHYPKSAHCIDPQQLGLTFAEHLSRNGAEFLRAGVHEMRHSTAEGWLLETTAGQVASQRVVVCAGYLSDGLMRPFGYRIPMEAERGYHLMLPSPGTGIRRVVSMAEAFVVATPMSHGIRLAGVAEFAGRNAPMNERRATMMYRAACRYMPNLRDERARPWMGNRPSLPDGLPMIGRASVAPELYYCFGHNHNGLMQGAISGRIIADLVSDRPQAIDLSPYRIERAAIWPSRQ